MWPALMIGAEEAVHSDAAPGERPDLDGNSCRELTWIKQIAGVGDVVLAGHREFNARRILGARDPPLVIRKKTHQPLLCAMTSTRTLLLGTGISAAMLFACVEPATGQAFLIAKPPPLQTAKEAVPKAAAEKAAAQAAADKATAAAKTAMDKAVAADAEARKAVTEKTAAERALQRAGDTVAALRKALPKVSPEKKADAEKAIAEGEAKVAAAKQALSDKEKAVKTTAQAVAPARAAADKAAAARRDADRSLAIKTADEKRAIDRVAAEETWLSVDALMKATEAKTKAEREATTKETAAKRTADQCAAAKALADKAEADRVAAEKALASASEANKDSAKKILAAKSAVAKASADKASAAKAAADKAAAELADARKALTEATKARMIAKTKEGEARAKALGGLKPLPADKWNLTKARHLMVRAAFGGTPAEVRALYEMGLHDAVEHLTDIYSRPVAHIEIDPLRYERMEPWESLLDEDERRILSQKLMGRERPQQAALRQWWMQRMAESPRPLQEKLTLFWHDHFATQHSKAVNTYAMYAQNQLFRTYGCDNYGALLRGIVHDPAMLNYLDNNVNLKNRGNENLGREILELFSMGEGRGYTEQDLREAARALTGYNYDGVTRQFRFNITQHDETPKTIFGRQGKWCGDDLVDLILQQPSTPKYIVEKLWEFLAYQQPEPEVVDTLANLLRNCSYDLRPMLKNLFLSEQFYSDKAVGTHIKGPAELAAGVIRDLGLKEVNYAVVDSAVSQMGQVLFEPPNVAGWNEHRTWINAELILVRYNQIARIIESSKADLVSLLEGKGVSTPEQAVEQLARACMVSGLGEAKRKEISAILGDLPPTPEWESKRDQLNAKLAAALILLLSTPESQVG